MPVTEIPARRADSALPPTASNVTPPGCAPDDVIENDDQPNQDEGRQWDAPVGVEDESRDQHEDRREDGSEEQPGDRAYLEAGRGAPASGQQHAGNVGNHRRGRHHPALRD